VSRASGVCETLRVLHSASVSVDYAACQINLTVHRYYIRVLYVGSRCICAGIELVIFDVFTNLSVPCAARQLADEYMRGLSLESYRS
jgi:hypothetical protein